MRIVSVALFLTLLPDQVLPDCGARLMTELGQVHQVVGRTLTPVQVTLPINNGGREMRWQRLLLHRSGLSSSDWRLAVRDANHRVLQWFDPLSLPGGTSVWTGRFEEAELRLTLHGTSATREDTLQIMLTDVFVMPKDVENPFYSRQEHGQEAWQPLHGAGSPFSSIAEREAGDSIGLLITRGTGVAAACTGFAVGSNLLLTNWHCGKVANGAAELPNLYWDPIEVCATTLVDFSWDSDKTSNDFRCSRVVAIDQGLDYALIEIQPLNGQPPVLPLRIDTARLLPDDEIGMIHHPLAMTKQISTNCRVLRDKLSLPGWIDESAGAEFGHTCDTEGGSSGAPLIDREQHVRGLHHLGFAVAPGTCLPIDKVNKAIWMDRIVGHLQDNDRAYLDTDGYLHLGSKQ